MKLTLLTSRKTNAFHNCISICKKGLFIAFLLIASNSFSQQFTKVTNSIIANESSNDVTCSWVDFDNDGDEDLFVGNLIPSVAHPNAENFLYKNNCDGTFTKVDAMPSDMLTKYHLVFTSQWVDADKDGDLDLLFDSELEGRNVFYINDGTGVFEKNTSTSISLPTSLGVGMSWADYNNDGLVDLMVPRYNGFNWLFQNNGNLDFTRIQNANFFADTARVKTALWGDYDNDGFMDLVITVNQPYNIFYHNNGDGTFTKITNDLTSQFSPAYGGSWVDYDNDKDLDLFIVNSFEYASFLYRNDGAGNFTRVFNPVTEDLDVNQGGHVWADFDNDGDLDIYLTNFSGNRYYINDGIGNFTRVNSEIITNEASLNECYGTSVSDIDNDGDLDLFTTNGFATDINDFFYLNNGNSNKWLTIKLKGVSSNADAIGARVYVKATIGGIPRWQMREINSNPLGLGSGNNSLLQHFGLGNATTIDSLIIKWPKTNQSQTFTNVSVNQRLIITEDVNSIATITPCSPTFLPSDGGSVSGKIYQDNNANNIFDAAVDFPIANRIVKITPGDYFTYTDENGIYVAKLPVGNYTISLPTLENDNRTFAPGQSVALNSSVVSNTNNSNLNFALKTISNLGTCRVTLDVKDIPFLQGPCAAAHFLTDPCPGYQTKYCIDINNGTTSGTPIPALSTLAISTSSGLPFNIVPTSFSSNPLGLWTPTPTALPFIVQNQSAIAIGANTQICFRIVTPAGQTTPFNITATLTIPNTGPPLVAITNPNFTLGNVGFTSQYASPAYVYGCPPPATNSPITNANSYAIINNVINCGPYKLNPLAGNYMYVNGWAPDTTMNLWCETMSGLTIGTTYALTVSMANPLFAFSPAQMKLLVDGVAVGGSTTLTNTQNSWQAYSFPFVAGTANPTLCLVDVTGVASGNDIALDNFLLTKNCNGVITDVVTFKPNCPCDPNDKTQDPIGCGSNHNISRTEKIKYHINYQNIGGTVATDVIVIDNIDSNLDLSSLLMGNSKYPISSYEILPNNKLQISYLNTNLPDSASDLEGSKGYIEFYITPKSTTSNNTKIYNHAAIYFDRNSAVITNSTFYTVKDFPQPDVDFTFVHSCTNTANIYNFSYTGLTPQNALFNWDFGVNASPRYSTDANPQNISFSTNDIQIVSLTVEIDGCSSTLNKFVEMQTILVGNKVKICHNGHVIQVNQNALQAHLNHGDCVGDCNNNNRISNSNDEDFLIEEITVIPHPANDYATLIIKTNNAQYVNICIYNLLGEKILNVYDGSLNDDGTLQTNLNLSHLANGSYILSITDTEYRQHKQVLIKQ